MAREFRGRGGNSIGSEANDSTLGATSIRDTTYRGNGDIPSDCVGRSGSTCGQGPREQSPGSFLPSVGLTVPRCRGLPLREPEATHLLLSLLPCHSSPPLARPPLVLISVHA